MVAFCSSRHAAKRSSGAPRACRDFLLCLAYQLQNSVPLVDYFILTFLCGILRDFGVLQPDFVLLSFKRLQILCGFGHRMLSWYLQVFSHQSDGQAWHSLSALNDNASGCEITVDASPCSRIKETISCLAPISMTCGSQTGGDGAEFPTASSRSCVPIPVSHIVKGDGKLVSSGVKGGADPKILFFKRHQGSHRKGHRQGVPVDAGSHKDPLKGESLYSAQCARTARYF